MAREFHPVSLSDLPFPEVLEGFEWVEDFLQVETLQDQVAELRAQRKKIKKFPSARAELVKRAKASFKVLQTRRLNRIAKYLLTQRESQDPFKWFGHGPRFEDFPPAFTERDLTAALALIPEGEGITDQERSDRLEVVERQIAERVADLQALSPTKFFAFKNAKVDRDLRETFVNFWRMIQARCNGPVGPRGISLSQSLPAEQAAWDRLGLRNFIRLGGRLDPHPGSR